VSSDLEIAIALGIACLLISAFCAGTEVAVFSIRRLERGQLAQSKRFADRRILAVLERPRPLIATMLIGAQVSNTVLAVLAYLILCGRFTAWPALWLAIAIALPLIVLVTGITARTLAAKSPLAWARLCILPLSAFAIAIAPVRIVIQAITAAVLAPFGGVARPRANSDLSEEEFRTLVDAGSVQGQVDARERRLIHRVFEFNDKNVGQVMTPRNRIFALSYDLPVQRLVKELAGRGFSRVPIYQRSLDNVRGILNAKDLVRTTAGQPLGRPLGELLHEPLFVPRTTPIKRLFLTFKQKKVHMAIVVSEYGKVLGLVTMDDLLSQIFGVIRDERTALQNTIPPGRGTARIPGEVRDFATGPIVAPLAGSPAAGRTADALGSAGDAAGDRGAESDGNRGETGAPRARGDERSGPVIGPDVSPGAAIGVLDPPPRPIHIVDEVTPPATDIADLERSHGEDGRRS
jgi:magnesium and cobalt exporter, CNNM family